MRKKPAVLLAGCLAVVLLITAMGCGNSPTDQAKAFMQKGDALLNVGSKMVQSIEPKVQSIISTITSDLAAGKLPDKATADKAFAELKTITDPIKTDYAKAKVQYQNINKLSGVPDYQTYAGLRIDQIDSTQKIVSDINAFIDETNALIQAGSFDRAKWTADGTTLLKNIVGQTARAAAAAAAAVALKSLKKL